MRREKLNINHQSKLTPEAFDKLIGSLSIPAGKPKEQVWLSIFENINTDKQALVIPFGRIFLKVAASVVLVLGLSSLVFFYGLGNVEVNVKRGSRLVHFLPDSSQVIINAESVLSYNKNRWVFQRNVKLRGEAMFKVTKGSKFQVQTSTATTSVLGTIFNVRDREGFTAVSCIEGRVKVMAMVSKKEVILTKGDETKTKGEDMEKFTEASYSNNKVAWTKGDFHFNNTPINSVIDELERQFDVDIFIDGDTNRFYTGYFSNKNLNNALELVCVPMNFNWKVSGNMIILKENK